MSHRVLVVFAHPDDAERGCAGIIANWIRNQQAAVRYICVTSGERTSRAPAEWSPAKIAAVREQHTENAARVTGVTEVDFLRFPDGLVTDNLEELATQLSDIFSNDPPAIILTHDYARTTAHPDHLAVSRAVLKAIAHTAPSLWFFRPETPNRIVDISEEMKSKLLALVEHRVTVDKARVRCVVNACRRIGDLIGCRYGEEFRVADIET